jgi:hypothetical protein
MDYLNKPLSRRTSRRSSRASSPPSSRFSRHNPPKKLSLAYLEDPLLATMSATTNSMPLTPPADEPAIQSLDATSKLPDTPIADQFAFDELEGEQSEPELDVQNAHLVTHAKVYAIAEKYVYPFVIVCSSLSVDPGLLLVLHLRMLVASAPTLRCVGLHGISTPTSPAICVSDLDTPIAPLICTALDQISGFLPCLCLLFLFIFCMSNHCHFRSNSSCSLWTICVSVHQHMLQSCDLTLHVPLDTHH